MTRPLVSIVIPCFNGEGLVADAIRSALKQTCAPVQVIVIDDGSTDKSLEEIRPFHGQIQWESGPNRGACAARNRGLDLAQGEFVQFLDADDLLHREKCERQVGATTNDPDSIIYCDGEIVDRMGAKKIHAPESAMRDAVEFAVTDWISTPAPLHRRALLESIGGFDESLPCSQERDLHLRLACEGASFVHLKEVLYHVRQQAGSVSDNWLELLDQRAKIFQQAVRRLQADTELSEARAKAFADIFARDARDYLYLNHEDRASRNFRLANELHRSGGLDRIYTSTLQLAAHRLLGPIHLNRLIDWKRKLVGRRRPASSATS